MMENNGVSGWEKCILEDPAADGKLGREDKRRQRGRGGKGRKTTLFLLSSSRLRLFCRPSFPSAPRSALGTPRMGEVIIWTILHIVILGYTIYGSHVLSLRKDSCKAGGSEERLSTHLRAGNCRRVGFRSSNATKVTSVELREQTGGLTKTITTCHESAARTNTVRRLCGFFARQQNGEMGKSPHRTKRNETRPATLKSEVFRFLPIVKLLQTSADTRKQKYHGGLPRSTWSHGFQIFCPIFIHTWLPQPRSQGLSLPARKEAIGTRLVTAPDEGVGPEFPLVTAPIATVAKQNEMEHLECSGDEKDRQRGRKMTTKELARYSWDPGRRSHGFMRITGYTSSELRATYWSARIVRGGHGLRFTTHRWQVRSENACAVGMHLYESFQGY